MAGLCVTVVAEPLKIDVKRKPADKEWKSYDTWTLAQAEGFNPRSEPASLSIYGGDTTRKAAAKGYFYSPKIGDRWWLVDPEGNLFINIAICSLSPASGSERAKAAFEKKFGTEEKWAAETTVMMRSNGFNGSGSWSKDAVLGKAPQRVAYCPNWNFMSSYGKKRGGTFQKPGQTGYPKNAIFVFDPEFEAFSMEHAKQLAAAKDDPWLLGHFSDNEMPLSSKCLEDFLSLPKDDFGYKAASEWLQKRKEGTADSEKITAEDREAFLEAVVERYFAIVSKAIKTHDPNHLYLGCRFHGNAKNSRGVFRAAGKYADIISVNLYGAWTPDFKQMDDWVKYSGKPFLITEFYAKGEDSGMPNTGGAGWLVKTQRERGYFYQNFCIALLESKGCVGWHYFRYQDNDLEWKDGPMSNQDSNKGIMTAYYDEYTDYLTLMRELNINVYDLIGWMDKKGRAHPQ